MPSFDEPPDLRTLTTLVRDCTMSGVPRRVLLLRTDMLRTRLPRPHLLRLAHEALEPLLRAERARTYELPQDRIAVSWRGEAAEKVGQVLGQLEHLLQDTPLDGPSMPEVARLFDLPRDGAAMLALATGPTLAEQQEQAAAPRAAPPIAPLPLTAAMLDGIEARIVQANLARFARRRAVCRLGAAGFVLAWEARFLSVPALMAELAPAHDAFADPSLRPRLSRMMDRRTLALLSSAPELRGAAPCSLPLTVAGLLSPEFLRFDGALPPGLRGQALIEMEPADVMANLLPYRFARTFARARGYRILLRGLGPVLLGLLDLAALDADFLELDWTPGLGGLDPALLQAGSARWVLAGVDGPDAIQWARRAGIGLMCGEAVQPGAGHAAARAAA